LVLGVAAWAASGAAPDAAGTVFYYLAAYAFMSNGAFLFLRFSGLSERSQLRGYARRRPAQAAAFAALLLALAGIPPTAGFLAKFLVLWDAVKAGYVFAALAAGLASLAALGYYLGMLRDMCFEAPEGAEPEPPRGSAWLWACALPPAALGAAPWLARR